jgi:hypothetical protein
MEAAIYQCAVTSCAMTRIKVDEECNKSLTHNLLDESQTARPSILSTRHRLAGSVSFASGKKYVSADERLETSRYFKSP